LLDADQLAGEHGADVDFSPFVAEATTVRDQRGSVMKRLLEIAQPLIGSGRVFVEFRGHFHVQRSMRPILVVVLNELIEASLLKRV